MKNFSYPFPGVIGNFFLSNIHIFKKKQVEKEKPKLLVFLFILSDTGSTHQEIIQRFVL